MKNSPETDYGTELIREEIAEATNRANAILDAGFDNPPYIGADIDTRLQRAVGNYFSHILDAHGTRHWHEHGEGLLSAFDKEHFEKAISTISETQPNPAFTRADLFNYTAERFHRLASDKHDLLGYQTRLSETEVQACAEWATEYTLKAQTALIESVRK